MAKSDSQLPDKSNGDDQSMHEAVQFDAPRPDPGFGWIAFKQYWVEMWTGTLWFFRAHWLTVTILTAIVLTCCYYVVYPYDRESLDFIRAIGGGKKSTTMDIANFIGDSGDLVQYNIIVTSGLWFFGRWLKKKNWQRVAVATFMSCLLAGLLCNIFRPTLGRPRPSAQASEHLEDRFYGPKTRSHFHGFPSGHAATAFGTAVPVAICIPSIGVPVLAYAGSMAWARMYQQQHHPTDVIVGGFIGTVFGIAGAMTVRRRNCLHGLLPVPEFEK